jgi:hypothetical protein
VTAASHCAHASPRPPGEPSAAGLQSPPQGLRLDEVRERALAVDLDDRNRCPIGGLQLGIPADVDALEVAGRDVLDDLERPLAEVTPLRGVDDDSRDTAPA